MFWPHSVFVCFVQCLQSIQSVLPVFLDTVQVNLNIKTVTFDIWYLRKKIAKRI